MRPVPRTAGACEDGLPDHQVAAAPGLEDEGPPDRPMRGGLPLGVEPLPRSEQAGNEGVQGGGGEKPFISLRAMNREFSELRRNTPWLKELPCHPVRHVLKYQDDAWKRAFAGKGFPQFRARGRDRDASVTFPPKSFQVRGDRLQLAKIGWMEISRRGGNPYEGYPVKQVVVKPNCGKWYAVLFHDVPDEVVATPDNGHKIGVDMNVGQVATSEGEIIPMPDLAKLEARKRRYQRRLDKRHVPGSNRYKATRRKLARTCRRIRNARAAWQHETSRRLADSAGTVCVEALDIPDMLESGNTALSRGIGSSAWGGLIRKLGYKAHRLVAVPPMYTSQTCSECGHVSKDNRKRRSEFACVACGYSNDADLNAALNILALGTGAAGRGGGSRLQ